MTSDKRWRKREGRDEIKASQGERFRARTGRDGLIQFIERSCGAAAVMAEPPEVLGYFKGENPGWYVAFRNEAGKVRVACVPLLGQSARLVSQVPWEHWFGDNCKGFSRGDNPEQYRARRDRNHGGEASTS